MAIELTRAQETQLRRTGREAMEKVITAAQQATSNGIQRATAKVTAVNSDYTVDVDFGTDEYPMKLTGLRYTTGCFGVKAGERVLVDTVGNQPLVTAVLANADNGPYVELFRSTSQPATSPVSVSGTGNLNDYESLMVWGCTSEWRRCYTRVWHQSTFHHVYFTLIAFNGSGGSAYLKCTDFRISLDGDKWSIAPNAYNEFAGTSSKTIVNTAIGPSITRIVGVRKR